MDSQSKEFTEAYGEAMYYAYLIEDLVILHIYECSWYHVNGYSGVSRKQLRDLKSEDRINELAKIYHKQKDGVIERLVAALHLLRKIRNKLTHAFIPQVGSDFEQEEGLDQIIAMLKRISLWERYHLRTLRRVHETVLNRALTRAVERALERDDPPFDARVARSKIQEYLDEIESLSLRKA